MIKKNYSKTGKNCRITFKYVPEKETKTVAVCGEFNNWDASADPMEKRKDGSFSATVSLDAGKSYRFKYFADEERWETDPDINETVPNEFGTVDSILNV
jgi:1,4-alpha-glucan branching enzyme